MTIAVDLGGKATKQTKTFDAMNDLKSSLVTQFMWLILSLTCSYFTIVGILEREQEQSVVYGSIDFGKTVVTSEKYTELVSWDVFILP